MLNPYPGVELIYRCEAQFGDKKIKKGVNSQFYPF